MTKKKSAVALYKAKDAPAARATLVVDPKPTTLTDEDVKAGLEALVREIGKDKTRLFLEAVVNGKLRGESVVERLVRRNPVAAVVTAGVAGALVGALFGAPQLPLPQVEDEP